MTDNTDDPLSGQDYVLLDSLTKFYSEQGKLDKLVSIIEGTSSVSLRVVDWFATNYAKANFTTVNNERGDRVKVYIDYKLHLRAYSKKRFDPFCRWVRMTIPYKDGSEVKTTIGQLNFFKWAIDSGVVDYIEANRETVERDMNQRNSTAKRRVSCSGNRTRKKREELSISATKGVKMEKVDTVVTFN